MKKIISYVLLLAMCLALFAGCAPKADNSGLESAKTYLYNMYKETDGSVTAVSYTRVGVVTIQNVGTYTVDWTVNSDAITVTRNDKMVSITIPDYPEAEIAYTLTATIKDDKGNSVTVSFDYTVPAAAGQPATLADGTYVITNGKVTMSSLDASSGYGYPTGNEVTIADGKVTGHKAADVLTIKNVEGGVTIQDAHGRYFYLKGTYNSFNVDATAPAEGHIWEVLKNSDGLLLVNTMNKKTLAYSASYSSWGAYPELTDDHSSALTIVAATAPSGGDNTEKPAPAPSTNAVEKPVAGTAYQLAIIQGNKGNATLLFTGKEKENYPWYILSTQTASESVDVYLEEVTGGLRLYFMVGSTKTYLDMHKDGTHYSLRLTTTPTAVYTWNTEHKTLVATVEGVDCFIGTSGTYDTFSCNKLEKIDSSFPARFYAKGADVGSGSTSGSGNSGSSSSGSTSSAQLPPVTAPVAGTTYKFGMIQVKTGNTVYIAGGIDQDRYLTVTTDKSAALDVTVEASGDGFKFATTVGGSKVYITLGLNSAGKTALSYTADGTVWKFNSELNCWYAPLDGTDYYIGSYNTFETISASKTSFINATNSGVSQFPAGFFEA